MCAALPGGDVDSGTQLILWHCSAGTYDQGWGFVPQFLDATGHQCYDLTNMAAFEDGYNPPQVIGVYAGNMTDGASVVVWQFYDDALGHKDQFWCAY